ncbi:MAG TPA: sn-glycerol-3-phosphate ABC transporter ATP-binding protein UgpC [Gaiellaceae bacterium]
MASLSLSQVRKVYGNGVEAVHDLDLDVDDGEFVVLVGPSGCGKTTALRMVSGLEEITSGTLRFDGKVVNDLSPRERDVAMVFQNYALYPHLSVAENIGFSLEMRGVPKQERSERVREAAAILGLSELLDRQPRHLSGGQRQRVAMGRAIVRRPAVFLMDEPLSNLDAKLRVQMRSEVLRVHRELGVATLYVTHDQTEAMTMGDRVAVLRGGVLQQCETSQRLYDHPVNLFVASFIGSPSMNLYRATLARSANGMTMRLGSQTLELPAELLSRLPSLPGYDDRELIVGIRPEHFVVPDGAPVDEGRALVVDVELVEPLGNELLVHFSIDAPRVHEDSESVIAADAGAGIAGASHAEGVARADPRVTVRAGTRTTFAVDLERLHFFDSDTLDTLELRSAINGAPP